MSGEIDKKALDAYITREPDPDETPMTLTEMLDDCIWITDVAEAKKVFTEWLEEVGLPLMTSTNKHGDSFNATESIRKLLITLVDEP